MEPLLVAFRQPGLSDLVHLVERVEHVGVEHFVPIGLVEALDESVLIRLPRLYNVSRSEIPAVTHVDYSARVQTVHRDTNPRYHALISEFKRLTECPVIVNTSFNVRGEPIVGSPEDAFHCFMGTEIDALAIGNCYMEKSEQSESLKLDYKNESELD